jgi:hypothetical protein
MASSAPSVSVPEGPVPSQATSTAAAAAAAAAPRKDYRHVGVTEDRYAAGSHVVMCDAVGPLTPLHQAGADERCEPGL